MTELGGFSDISGNWLAPIELFVTVACRGNLFGPGLPDETLQCTQSIFPLKDLKSRRFLPEQVHLPLRPARFNICSCRMKWVLFGMTFLFLTIRKRIRPPAPDGSIMSKPRDLQTPFKSKLLDPAYASSPSMILLTVWRSSPPYRRQQQVDENVIEWTLKRLYPAHKPPRSLWW
jgi:hypothetical protein